MSQEKTHKQHYYIVGAALSVPAFIYSALCVVYYAWLTVVEPERWPVEKAAIFIVLFLVLAVIFIICFIFSVFKIKKKKV